jgi:uncharacterized integral membrane protein (TIGR00698 family)
LAAVAVMLVSIPLADGLGRALLALQGIASSTGASPVSSTAIAVLLGIAVRNLVPSGDRLTPGVRVGVTTLLRTGIVLVGIKLSLTDLMRLGAWGLPIVLTAIASGLVFVHAFGRLLRLPPRLVTLIAAGTSICGVTAVVSTAGAIDANEKEVSYAVSTVTVFGLIGMMLYPHLAAVWLDGSAAIGLFLGTAIHDTSQVLGAALTYRQLFHDDVAFTAATITKLTRNLFLAAVVPLLSFLHLRHHGAGMGRVSWTKVLPMFVLGFVGMAIVRSAGDLTLANGRAFGLWRADTWSAITTFVGDTCGSRALLGTALASVGLGTRLSVFRELGPRPFVLGFAAALWVGLVGLAMARVLGGRIVF